MRESVQCEVRNEMKAVSFLPCLALPWFICVGLQILFGMRGSATDSLLPPGVYANCAKQTFLEAAWNCDSHKGLFTV